MKKISMISTLPPTKGVSPYTLGLIKELSKNCEIEFYGFKSIYPGFLYPGKTKTAEKETEIKNVEIHNYLTWYNPFSWMRTGFAIRADILHVQWWSWFLAPEFLIILLIAKFRGKNIIMTVHNVKPHEKSRIKNLLNKSVIGLADKYIVHCEENKKLFLEDIRTNKDIFVVPHGVEEIENPSIPKEDLRKKYGLSLNDTVLLFFGNIREYKGLDILIKSLKDIDAKLIIAGKPWKKFEEAKSIDKLKLNDKIKLFLDFNPNKVVAELFKISDLVILPYKEFEAASGAGTVALNFGKPLVVTDVGGLPELVKDKNVITKPNCVEDLTEKIEYALKNLKKLESDSKEIALKFSWKSVAQKTLEVYN